MKKLMFMISTHGKSKKKVTDEAWEAYKKYWKVNDPLHYQEILKKEKQEQQDKKQLKKMKKHKEESTSLHFINNPKQIEYYRKHLTKAGSYVCKCGKFDGVQYRGVICDVCGTQVRKGLK